MIEPIDNYPLSTEKATAIPFEIAKPGALFWLNASLTPTTLTFKAEDNNIFTVTAEVLTFISTNPAINSVADLATGVANEGVYVVTPDYAHVLALPKTVKVFSIVTAGNKNIYLQELVRWAALGGQAITYGVS